MKGHRATTSACFQSYRQRSNPAVQAAGIVLIAFGLTLLFICIPGWAWAAAAGLLLITAGYLLLRLNDGRR